MKARTMRDRFVDTTAELIDEDPRVCAVLAEISVDRFRSTGVMARHPHRVINVGIREQLLINVGAGMALEGMRPYVHTFASFLVERPFEQIKLGFSHQGVGGVLVSSGGSYDTAAYGRTHGSPGDVALMSTLPGWRIIVPGHADEVEHAIREAARSDDPVYIRLSERQNAEPIAARNGSLAVVRTGSPGAPVIIAVGPMLTPALEATAGLDATVLYATTIRPLDAATLSASIGTDPSAGLSAAADANVVLIEPYLEGTSAAAVTAALAGRAVRLLCIGVPNTEDRHYGSPQRHDAAHALDAAGLRARVEAWIR